jgi:hypothetical protein
MGALTDQESKAEQDFEKKQQQKSEFAENEEDEEVQKKQEPEKPKVVQKDTSGVSGSIDIKEHDRNFEVRDIYSRSDSKPYTEKVYDSRIPFFNFQKT